jgi:hypothetical protein
VGLHHGAHRRDVALLLAEGLRLAAAHDIQVEDVPAHEVAERVDDRAVRAGHGGRKLRVVKGCARIQHANRGPDVMAERVGQEGRRHRHYCNGGGDGKAAAP